MSTALQSVDAEQAVLGACLEHPGAYASIEKLVGASDFARVDHATVFRAIQHLHDEGITATPASVLDHLAQSNQLEAAGGREYIRGLLADNLAQDIGHYARRVREASDRRKLFHALENLAAGARDPDGRSAADLTAHAHAVLSDLEGASDSTHSPLQLLPLKDYLVKPATSWLCEDLIPGNAIVVVFGPPKSGKTHAVSDITLHAAHGMPWHGHAIARPLRVAYLVGEGRNGHRVRLRAWQRHHQGAELKGDFQVIDEAVSLVGKLAELLKLLREYAPDIIVIDTLNAYFGASDENSTQDMTGFVAALRRIRDELRCAVLVVHHTGLADAGRERGSSVLRAAADVIVQVARDEGGSGLVGLQVIEARDAEAWSEPISLRLISTDTDWTDTNGDPMASVVIEAADQAVTLPGRGGRPLGDAQHVVMEIAKEMARQGKPDAAGEVMLARYDISVAAKLRGVSRQSVSSAWRPLAARGLLKLVEPGSIRVRVRP